MMGVYLFDSPNNPLRLCLILCFLGCTNCTVLTDYIELHCFEGFGASVQLASHLGARVSSTVMELLLLQRLVLAQPVMGLDQLGNNGKPDSCYYCSRAVSCQYQWKWEQLDMKLQSSLSLSPQSSKAFPDHEPARVKKS